MKRISPTLAWELFRPSARKALGRPEAADDRPQLAALPVWLSVSGALAALVLLLSWAFLGNLSVQIETQTILTRVPGGIEAEMALPYEKVRGLRPGGTVVVTSGLAMDKIHTWQGALLELPVQPLSQAQRAKLPSWLQAKDAGPLFRVRARLEGQLPHETMAAQARLNLTQGSPIEVFLFRER